MALLRKLTGAIAALPAVGIGYSTLMVDHDMQIPLALSAETKTMRSRSAGAINYYQDLSGSGRPLVLVHSINAAGSAKEMQPLFDHYRGQRPVYAIDLPGFGFSDRSARDYTPQLYADTIGQFIQDVVAESADVIALSLGCEFVAIAAFATPELFNSLAFISPTGFTGSGTEGSSERASRNETANRSYKILSFPLWEQALFDLISSKRSIRYFLSQSFKDEPPVDLLEYAYLTSHQPNGKNAPLHFISGGLFTKGIAQSTYAHLPMSTLVLFDEDQFINFDQLSGFVDKHEQWQAVRIVDTRGLPHWEKSAETIAALDHFWQAENQSLPNTSP